MVLQSVAQWVFASGVPLFIMLTGYLNINKTVSRKYYSGIWRVLVAYLFFSVATMLFRNLAFGDPLSATTAVKKILGFSSFMYGWYIEMWIGLFLLVPFLNILYKGIETARHKRILLLTLAALTLLPCFTNRYGLQLLPDYWKAAYPIAFYFIGCYIREYSPRTNRWLALATIMTMGLIPPLATMLLAPGHTQISVLGDCFGIFGAISAVLVFLMLYSLKCTVRPLATAIRRVSILSLDMYLCCYIFDSMVYPWFKERYFVDQQTFALYFFIIVPIIFSGAFTLSLAKRMLFSLPVLKRVR